MCMEAQYKRLNEKNHGPNYVLKVTAKAVESLKDLCEKQGAWNPNDGAYGEDVLEVIRLWEHGLSTVISPVYQPWYKVIFSRQNIITRLISRRNHQLNRAGPSIRLKSYETIMDDELSPLKITSMLHKMGPLVGVLYTDEAYDNRTSTVYRGNRDFAANHVVVCTGYHYVDGELCIVIMDSDTCEGPVQTVLYEAFEEFHVLTVDPI